MASIPKPQASDYLQVIASPTQDGQYYLRVKQFGGSRLGWSSGQERWKQVGIYLSREEAEAAALRIWVAMRWFKIDSDIWERRREVEVSGGKNP